MTEEEIIRASLAYENNIEDDENYHPTPVEILRYAIGEAQHNLEVK